MADSQTTNSAPAPTTGATATAAPAASPAAASPSTTAAPAAQPAPSQPVPAASAPSLLGAEPTSSQASGEPQNTTTPPVDPEAAARVEAFAKAEGKDAKLDAWSKLTKDQQVALYKDMKATDAKALGIDDPSIPTYTDFKMPEGVTVDPKVMGEATELFKEARLPQEAAQKFVDFHASQLKAAAEAQARAFVDLQTRWHGEVMADPEIGGSKWQDSASAANRLMDRLNIPGLKDALNLTGAGNHPAVVKAFVRLGQMVSEDKVLTGAPGPTPSLSLADRIYGPPRRAES